jgi:hypothetical protein
MAYKSYSVSAVFLYLNRAPRSRAGLSHHVISCICNLQLSGMAVLVVAVLVVAVLVGISSYQPVQVAAIACMLIVILQLTTNESISYQPHFRS